jgi:mannosyltransferase OCH1-like enzyme
MEQKIPKILHYCWFGGNQLPDIVQRCMESWKKYCPDYEIIKWDESNFDINCCDYVKEAYEAKKWAFVSDYCRFYILNKYGGIYLDTDVELIKPLDDLLDHSFVGFESKSMLNSGLVRGVMLNDTVCQKMLESYDGAHFLLADGSLNLQTVCERETQIFESLGMKRNGKSQFVCNTNVLSSEYFCPLDTIRWELNLTENTYSIHHYDSSWISDEKKYAKEFRKKHKHIPRFMALHISGFIAAWKFRGFRAAIKEISVYFRDRKKQKKRERDAKKQIKK